MGMVGSARKQYIHIHMVEIYHQYDCSTQAMGDLVICQRSFQTHCDMIGGNNPTQILIGGC